MALDVIVPIAVCLIAVLIVLTEMFNASRTFGVLIATAAMSVTWVFCYASAHLVTAH